MLLAKAVAVQWCVTSWVHVAGKINCLHPASSPLLDIDITQCKNRCFMQGKTLTFVCTTLESCCW